jgi:cell wall assembly regulator SMI1
MWGHVHREHYEFGARSPRDVPAVLLEHTGAERWSVHSGLQLQLR